MSQSGETSTETDLTAMFAPASVPAETAAALQARAEQFRHVLARGGSRDDFTRWQASLDALQAALSVLRHASGKAGLANSSSHPPLHSKESHHGRHQF